MSIAPRASAEAHVSSGPLTVPIPVSVQAGDLMLIFAGLNNGGSPTYNWATPDGWTKKDDRSVGANLYGAVYARYAVSGDAGGTVVLASASIGKSCAVIDVYSGVDAAAGIEDVVGFSETGSTAAHATPAVAADIDQDWVIIAAVQSNSVTESWSTPAGYTKRQDSIDNVSPSGHVTATVQDKGPVSVGTYGGESLTAAGASIKAATWTVILSPRSSTQTSRPVSDVTITSAVGVPTPGTGVYEDLAVNDDVHYAKIDNSGIVEVGMTAAVDPVTSSGYSVSYRAKYADGASSGTVVATLKQGSTTIASWTDTLTASFQTFSHSLTGGQADAITDHTALRMRFVPSVS